MTRSEGHETMLLPTQDDGQKYWEVGGGVVGCEEAVAVAEAEVGDSSKGMSNSENKNVERSVRIRGRASLIPTSQEVSVAID